MTRPLARSRPRIAIPIAIMILVCAGAWAVLETRGLAAAILLSLLWLIWRFDNPAGTWLVLAVLFLIALAVPAPLLALMGLMH